MFTLISQMRLNTMECSHFVAFHLPTVVGGGGGCPSKLMSVFNRPTHEIKLILNYKRDITTINNITKNLFVTFLYNIYYLKTNVLTYLFKKTWKGCLLRFSCEAIPHRGGDRICPMGGG